MAKYYKRTFTTTNGTTAAGTANIGTYTITVSNGNKKLVSDHNVKYIVWNIPAIVTCPFRTAACEKSCYARKAEKNYPGCLPCRYSNLDASKEKTFVDNMIALIQDLLHKPSYKNCKKIVYRIHESGDFYSQEYFNKWLKIAEHFKDNKKLVFVAYTKSVNFIHGIPCNMVIRYSIWDDTEPDQIAKAAALNLPIYTAVNKFQDEPQREKCNCINCSTCFKCFNNKFEILKCEIH